MHKRAFQGVKRTFMHVSSLPSPYFDEKKPITLEICFSYPNMVGADMIHA